MEYMKREGFDAKDFGTHSFLKGSTMFCTSGTTHCPSVAAVYIRAGWTIEGVQNRYVRYEAAGDQFVGRTVCGLPVNSIEFAAIAPSFPVNDPNVSRAVQECFPGAPAGPLCGVLERVLASVVYHERFLRKTLPPTHPIWTSPLFRAALFKLLSECVKMSLFVDAQRNVTATGLPPTIAILGGLAKVTDQMAAFIPALKEQAKEIVDSVDRLLIAREVDSGTVTAAVLQQMLDKSINSVLAVVTRPTVVHDIPAPPPAAAAFVYRMYTWGKRLRKVPPDFKLRISTMQVAWNEWCLGATDMSYPPLRSVDPRDLTDGTPTRNNECKRFSDLRYVMGNMEEVRTMKMCRNTYSQCRHSRRRAIGRMTLALQM